MTYPNIQLRTKWPKAIAMLFLIALGMLILATVVGGLLLSGGMTTARLRIFATLQDVLVFIAPAVLTAVAVSNRPAELLGITKAPGLLAVLLSILALLVATPAMNALVSWNESIQFPEWMKGVELFMKQSEEASRHSVEILLGGTTTGDLISGLLIVGVLAGFSEEIFFRGGLMRLLRASGMNIHCAIWLTAVIFSTFHFQFYGFFPRVLLGAFFGYLFVWSGSLWLPAIIHAVNNSIVVTASWVNRCGYTDYDINTAGNHDMILILGSVILTLGVIRVMKKHLFN